MKAKNFSLKPYERWEKMTESKKTGIKLSSALEEKIVDKIVDLAQYMGEVTFYPYQTPFARRLAQSVITNEGATLSALFSRQCILEGSFVMDRNGKVLPINKHPDAWKTKDQATIYEIKTLGGHVIECTEEHPIATEKGWTPAQCVTKGMKVVVLDHWEKFGLGIIPYKDKTFTMSNDLAELVGWLTANIKNEEEIKVTIGHERVASLVKKYFLDSYFIERKTSFTLRLDGHIKNFLKYIIKYDTHGIPEGLNYFTKEQLIRFFYPLFLTNGKAYKKPNTIKLALKDSNPYRLKFYKEHLNKLGLHGNLETWLGWVLIFQCSSNYLCFKELFEEFLPSEFFPPYFQYRKREIKTFKGEDGEVLAYAKVHSVSTKEGTTPVWDLTVPDKGWFLTSGIKVHNSGKTQIVGMITAACMVVLPSLAERFPDNFGLFRKGFWAGCFGPVGEQAVTMFDRIHDVFTTDNTKRLFIEELKMPIPARGGARGNLIKLQNKSFVRYMSGSKRAKVESKTYHLIILDECQDMDSFKIRKSINPMGAAVNATTVATGTPDVYIGYFYDTIEQNKGYDLKTPSSKSMHFEVDYTIAQKYNPMYKKYIQKEIKRLGFDSDEFKMAYRLIWPITKGMVFTKSQLEEKCYDKSLKIVKEYHETPCIAGLDLGKAQNSTVVFVIRPFWEDADEEGNMPKQVLNWMELEGDDWEDQYPKVVDFLSPYSVETLVCDATGLGDPISERYAILLPKINVVPFVFSPSSKDVGYKYLIQEINNNRLLIPAHTSVRNMTRFKKFEQQMTTLKKHYSGKFLNPSPIDADKGHDDYCDSLMLSVFGTFFDVMPEIEETENNLFFASRNNIEQVFGRNYSRPRKI
jgi:hypothetical protein